MGGVVNVSVGIKEGNNHGYVFHYFILSTISLGYLCDHNGSVGIDYNMGMSVLVAKDVRNELSIGEQDISTPLQHAYSLLLNMSPTTSLRQLLLSDPSLDVETVRFVLSLTVRSCYVCVNRCSMLFSVCVIGDMLASLFRYTVPQSLF